MNVERRPSSVESRLPVIGARAPRRVRRAFTLIEIMIVVALIGLIAAMGVPSILQTFRKEGMREALSDVQQLLGDARARAIFRGQTTEVVFHPAEKRMEIVDAAGDAPAPTPAEVAANGRAGNAPIVPGAVPRGSIALPASVDIAMLDINLLDYGASDTAFVRFFPNGTCDELTLVLHSGDEWEKISLEFSTALTTVGPVNR